MTEIEIIRDLLELVKEAINAGDWNVDGDCDADEAIEQAETALKRAGYRLDGLTGTEWLYEG